MAEAAPLSKLGFACVFALLGAFARCEARAPASTVEGVAKLLGDTVGGTVAPDDFIWEASSGALADVFTGRLVTFVASRGGAPRDVWRARVRVARSGRVLAVRELHQLTDTPTADEGELVGFGSQIAYRTTSSGMTVGLAVLLLAGDEPPEDAGRWERTLLSLERRLASGSSRGLGRVDLVLTEPARELRFDLDERGLVFASGDGVPSLVPLPPAPRGRALHQATYSAVDRTGPPSRGADLLGALATRLGAPGLGARLRARVRRPEPDLAPPAELGPVVVEAGWPPTLPAGERWGALVRTGDPLDPSATGQSPAPSPIAHLRLGTPEAPIDAFAFDLRQLDVELVAGASPAGRDGPAPIGGLSEEDGAALVGAFALSPASRVTLGSRELSPLLPLRVAFARRGQALSLGPLSGEASPSFALQGPELALEQEPLERSFLCRSREGRLLYFHAPKVRASAARGALERAGCEGWLTLAEWPHPAGLVLLGAEPRTASAGMTLTPRGLEAPAGPVAVLRRRAMRPEGGAWRPDGGEQPQPAWAPAIFSASATGQGSPIPIVRVGAERVRWVARVGRDEPGKLPAAAPVEPLLTLGVGTTRKKAAYGLALEGETIVRGHASAFGSVVVSPEGRVRVERGAFDGGRGSVVELPLVADEGKILPEGQLVGLTRMRAVLCVLSDGSVLVAKAELDTTEPLVLAVLSQGCTRVVELDRGSRDGTFVARKGKDALPEGAAAWTRLLVLPAVLDSVVAP